MKQQELEKHLWGAAILLRGSIDAGDYKQYIFPLLFFKRVCDIFDEEYDNAREKSKNDEDFINFPENYRFKIPKGAHWNDVKEKTTNVGMAIKNSMRSIEKDNSEKLYGIFGDASWTNKNRLTDEILIDLVDHFSKIKLNSKNIPDDQLGNAYEYLIKKFADDSGHTAAEFYTNRTVVQLMTKIMNPKSGDAIYDPTCGSGGLLLNCALKLREDNKEYRTIKLYGQEINLITSAIARMNMFLHGIEDFKIERGDTLKNPIFIENDELKKFDIILANPPYSIKSWDRKDFASDKYGRNIWGTPPQGCADYVFQQHIQKSLKESGKSCVLWPYGILFRDSEKEIRKQMINSDIVESIISLGKNLFYNSTMESCLLITNNKKPNNKKGKVQFIDARNEIYREKTISYLNEEHINKISNAFNNFKNINNFSEIVTIDEISKKNFSLNVPLYVSTKIENQKEDFLELYKNWEDENSKLIKSIDQLVIDYEK